MASLQSLSASPRRNQRIVFRYLVLSLAFGVLAGLVFPVYAGFFVTYRSERLQLAFTLGCIAAGLAVGLVSFLIGRFTVLAVVKEMSRRLGDLSEHEGDLTRDLDISSKDCVGHLASNFNRFQEKLRTMIAHLGELAERTRAVGFDLAANSTETSSASEQISAHMNMIREQTDLLIEEAENVDTARRRINDSAHLVSDNIDRQSEALTVLSALVEQTLDGIKSIAEHTERNTGAILTFLGQSDRSISQLASMAAKIAVIEGSVAQIGDLSRAIGETAERIGVLGINASIEAARAGAVGKGFGVVANEVRSLALAAQGNSERINQWLASVTADVSEGASLSSAAEKDLGSLLSSMRGNASEIRSVTERLSVFAGQADSMLKAHNDLVKVTIDVTESMVEMRDNTDVIETSMNVLLDTADKNKHAIDEITLGIAEIAVDVSELNRVSSVNAENIAALAEITGRFRTR